MMRGLRGALLDSVSATRGESEFVPIAPVPRPPLPPFPPCSTCPGPYEYDKELPWDPPKDDASFMRANAWAITIPGLPWVPGASSEFPERFLSHIAYRYSLDWQRTAWIATAERAYTHVVLSWSNFRDEYSDSPQAFVDFCGNANRYIQYVTCFFSSKDYDPRDLSVQQYQDRFGPVLETLLKARVVSETVSGWEWNLFNIPGTTTIDIMKWVGQLSHAAGASSWNHFSKEVTSWFRDGDERGRFGFWDDLGADVDGILYQADQHWDSGSVQSHIVDTLNQFATQGNIHKLRAFELIAMNQFSGYPFGSAHPDEADGDLASYIACCTHGPAYVFGYGNGGRRVDGSPL